MIKSYDQIMYVYLSGGIISLFLLSEDIHVALKRESECMLFLYGLADAAK